MNTSEEYVKKLERRIHNQRVALRDNWMIIEQRAGYYKQHRPLQSRWWAYAQRLHIEKGELLREINLLKGEIEEMEAEMIVRQEIGAYE